MIRLASRRNLAALLALCLGLLQLPAWALSWNKTRGPEGAWVVGLDQTSDGTLWLAARGGGAYSRSPTGTWTARNNGLSRFDVVDLVIAGNGTPVLATPGGLFRFSGGSWVAANSGIPFATNSNVAIESLFRAANGDLYASAGSLYRSSDHGQTWTETTSGMAGTVVLGTRLAGVRFVKQDSNGNLFAVTNDFGNRLYVSGNGGSSWAKQDSGLSGALVVSLSTDANGNAYAYMPAGDVYRTANGGQAWSRVANLGSAVPAGPHATLVTTEGVFYAGQGSNFVSSSLVRSTDGARYSAVTNLLIAGAPLHQQGSGALVLRRAADGRLLAGFNGAGVWQSSDGTRWTPMNEGLDAGLINVVFGGPGSLLAGGRGTGNQCSTDGGAAWSNSNFTLQSADVLRYLKPSGGNRLLMANIIRTFNASNIHASTDGGATWSAFANSQQPAITRMIEVGTSIVSSSVGTQNAQLSFMQSANGGQTWSTLSAPASGGNDIAADTAGNLFALSDGGIYRRSTGTTTWTRIDNAAGNGLPTPALWGSAIGDNNGNVYLVSLSTPTGQPGVYVSSNGGSSWERRSSGLPQTQLELGLANLRFEKGPNGAIYLLSKQAGLFRTTNAGSAWTDETGNLPTPVADPTGRRGILSLGFAADGTPFVGLEGNGVWVAGALGAGSYGSGVNCAAATGPDPDLDAGYGTEGVSIVPELAGSAVDAIVDGQDRLLAMGTTNGFQTVQVTRFTTDGDIDTRYGSDGVASFQTGQALNGSRESLALQADGKLVMALNQGFSTPQRCTLARLTADGVLDTSFGGTGIVQVPTTVAAGSSCSALTVASDGDILVAGAMHPTPQQFLFAVFRFNPDGSLDSGFDGDGVFTNAGASGGARILRNAAGGNILVAGLVHNADGSNRRNLVLQISASGVRDSSFGTAGELSFAEGTALGMDRHADGDFALLLDIRGPVRRYSAAGQAIGDFGTAGAADVNHPSNSGLRHLQFRADGSLLVWGNGSQNFLGTPILTLLNPDGSRNADFGGNGTRVFLNPADTSRRPCPNGADGEIDLDSLGRLLAAGRCDGPSGQQTHSFRTRVLPPASNAPAPDTTPDSFSFAAQTDVPTGSLRTSASATISGIDAPAPVSVTGGDYSIGCGSVFGNQAGTISNGQTVCVRHTASGQANTRVDTVLTVGGVSATFSSTTAQPPPPDTTPDAFSFGSRSDTEPGALVESETVTLRGINTATAISVSGGEYRVNGGSYRSTAGTVANGSTVQLRHTASLMFNTATVTTLNVGGVSASFTSTTRAQTEPTPDSTPDAFSFQAQTGVTPGSQVSSNGVSISGINVPTAISVSGGQYRIGTGAFTTQAGQVRNGESVQLRLVAATAGQTAEATLTIGGVSASFRVTSGPGEDPDPDGEGDTEVQLMDSADRPVRFEIASGRLFNTARVAVPGGAPQNVLFRNGFFAFEVGGIPAGGLAEIVIRLPAGSAPNAYYKYGTEPGVPFDHFYRFGYDAATDTGARIEGDVVTLRIRDNGRGDHDPRPGTIADPGGPAVETDLVDAESSSGGSLGWLGLAPLLLAASRRQRRVASADATAKR